MPHSPRVAVVGVGLIGGSIGLALLERGLAGEVVGVGRRQASLDRALARGAITRGTTNLVDGVSHADLVVVATPVDDVVDAVRSVARAAEHAVITDAGSTKADICRCLHRPSPEEKAAGAEPVGPNRFLGSHPLAGDHRTGPEYARADMFEGKVVVVTPEDATLPGLLARWEEFWQSLGANVVLLSPEEHDRAVAATSHLPHLIASALAAATPEEWLQLTATGWGDATRIAAADPTLWTQIFRQNRAAVIDALRRFEHRLAALDDALSGLDDVALAAQLQAAKRIRDAVGD